MNVIYIYIEADISGFESPPPNYKELVLSLEQLLIRHSNATFIGQASVEYRQEIGILMATYLL
jgi:DNA polymerase V